MHHIQPYVNVMFNVRLRVKAETVLESSKCSPFPPQMPTKAQRGTRCSPSAAKSKAPPGTLYVRARADVCAVWGLSSAVIRK